VSSNREKIGAIFFDPWQIVENKRLKEGCVVGGGGLYF
jgi:hypothetical protein